jgi:glycosyltransferase involved in cell wall biosynthesis
MNVLLVGNYAADGQYSMLGFGRALERGLPVHGIRTTSIAPRRKLWRPNGKADKWGAYFDKYVLFPRVLREAAAKADVVHVLDQGNGMYMPHLRATPHLVTCHDLLAIRSSLGELPYWQTGRLGRLYQTKILQGLQASQNVACVSHATKSDVDRLLHLSEGRARVIPMGPLNPWTERRMQPIPDSCRNLGLTERDQFVLQVGGTLHYKNCSGAVNVFAALQKLGTGQPSKLVIVGKELAPQVAAQIAELGLQDSILWLQGVSGTDLEWLYSNAWGLLMTSFDEGFGLPMLEAQSCGCPVFASHKAPMTEVGGSSALYIDSSKPTEAAATINNAQPRFEELRHLGYLNVQKFSTEAMVASYATFYKELKRN